MNEIYRGEDSIVRHWLKAPWSMDGWRLDSAHAGEAGGARNNRQHVAGITQAAKETQPEAYVVGEHFGDARQWLQADAEDAAMNYRGFFPVVGISRQYRYLLRPAIIDAQTCMAWMDNYRAQGFLISNNCGCLISSTATIPPDLNRCSVRRRTVTASGGVAILHPPGVPCIYYGDEVGLDGNNDPFVANRSRGSPEKQDASLGVVSAAGKTTPPESGAAPRWLPVIYAEDNVVVFVRVLNRQRVLVAINRGHACEVVLPASPLLSVSQWQHKEGNGMLCRRYPDVAGDFRLVWIRSLI